MEADGEVVHVERVCCLECGATYVRPADEGATREDTGCPSCGYRGWIFAIVPNSAA